MPTLIGTVVTAVFAFVASVASLVWQRRSSREIVVLQRRLENENLARTEFLKRYLEAFVQGHERELQAYRDILNAGQRVRDLLQRIADGRLTYDKATLAGQLDTRSNEMLDVYSVNQLYVHAARRPETHRFKSVCSDAAANLAKQLADNLPIADALRDLRPTREDLRIAHDAVRDSAIAAARDYVEELKRRGVP